MRHLERRLRTLEAAKTRKNQHWVWVDIGQTLEDAKAAYLSQHTDAAESDGWLFFRWATSTEAFHVR